MAKLFYASFHFLGAMLLGTTALAAVPQVDDLFADYARPGVPGAAVAVFHHGKVVLAQAYGLADVEKKIPVSARTNFRLASVTKQFTAMAVLRLIDAGKLTFERTLTEIFPGFHAYGSKITVRQLLHHTGGLRDYEELIPSGTTEQLTDADVLAIVKRQSGPAFAPGSQYRYSNGGYCVLAQIVEAVSGKSFAAFVKDEILSPLGMTGSAVFEKDVSVVPNRAYGYSPTSGSGGGFKKTDQSITSATQGDGGLYASVEELFLWDQALNEHSLLSFELMGTVFLPGKLNNGSPVKYGMGWMLDSYRGLKRQHHTGSTIGFRTSIIRIPEKNFTVVTLVNRANASPWIIGERIVDRFLF